MQQGKDWTDQMLKSFEKRLRRRDGDLTFASLVSSFLEEDGTFFKKGSYLEVLGTHLLALSAPYAL